MGQLLLEPGGDTREYVSFMGTGFFLGAPVHKLPI